MFGKFVVKDKDDALEAAPIIGVDVHAEVIDYCTRVTVTQLFRNTDETSLEASYVFNVPEGASVSSCNVEVGSRKLNVIVKEKNEAHDTYEDALAAGYSAMVVANKDEENRNLFSAQLGNVGPGEEAYVVLTYEMMAELEDDKLVLTMDGSQYSSIRFATSEKSDERIAPGFNLSVHVATQSRLLSVSSPSHPIVVEIDGDGLGATTRLAEGADWVKNKTFVLQASVADPHQPCARIQEHSDGSMMAMVTFYPHIEENDPKSEMIFVIDRSGSMAGSPIDCAKATLQFFLRSLPESAYFNIVGFGSCHQFFSETSVKYNNETLQRASDHVEKMKADFGCTNIYTPLKLIFSKPLKPGYSRQIFILTDGEVEEAQKCIEIVKKNAGTTRLFAFGIGNDVDEDLVRGMARAGEGHCCIVRNNGDIRQNVMKQLERSLQPALTDVHVSWNNSETGKPEEGVVQAPANPPPIFRGSQLVSFAVLPKSCPPCEVLLTGTFGATDYQSKVNVNPAADKIPGDQIVKMGAHSLIIDIEDGACEGDTVALSKKYHVLCKKTAFLAVGSTGIPLNSSMRSTKVERIDYSHFCSMACGSMPVDEDELLDELDELGAVEGGDSFDELNELDELDAIEYGCCSENHKAKIIDSDDDLIAEVMEDDADSDYERRRRWFKRAEEECDDICDAEEDVEDAKPVAVSLDSVIQQINADGSFPVATLSNCGFDTDDVLNHLPDGAASRCDMNMLKIIWATLIVAEMIRIRFAAKKQEWNVIIAKCDKFAQKKLGSPLFDAWVNAAKEFVSNH